MYFTKGLKNDTQTGCEVNFFADSKTRLVVEKYVWFWSFSLEGQSSYNGGKFTDFQVNIMILSYIKILIFFPK